MGFQGVLLHFSPARGNVPPLVAEFAREHGLNLESLDAPGDVLAWVNRGFPACILMDGRGGDACFELCRTLKMDAFSAIVPVVFIFGEGTPEPRILGGLEAGADEVLTAGQDPAEAKLRLHMALRRAERDVSVHPTTRLPGTPQIERDIAERLHSGELFAVCYADLDHFKEFNDRYGYSEGDKIIRILARILRDVVKGYSPRGFIGHIGGDDFIFNLPLDDMPRCCEEILDLFDTLIPFQYSPRDREAGYFIGTDRRGVAHRIPLMTLSIGVVTNRYRTFTHTGHVSAVAAEMKSYAKTLPGAVYAVDRRRDPAFRDPEEQGAASGQPPAVARPGGTQG
jgi:GGDEF domain-containing protein